MKLCKVQGNKCKTIFIWRYLSFLLDFEFSYIRNSWRENTKVQDLLESLIFDLTYVFEECLLWLSSDYVKLSVE